MSEPAQNGGTFYRFKDEAGIDHIVDSLSEIPSQYRQKAEKIDLKDGLKHAKEEIDQAKKEIDQGLKEAKKVQHEVSGVVPFVSDLDLPSIAVGFGLALFFCFLLSFAWKTGKLILKLGLLVAVLLFLGGGYLGWVRRATGMSTETLSGPAAIIRDAKESAGKMNRAIKEEERVLKKIDSDSR